jgi:predicted nuclease of predicted toxin-antitoxin system
MAQFLANENVPAAAVAAARSAGHDLAWIAEIIPGADDEDVLALSFSESRILVTFDKDFGKLAYATGRKGTCGVILLRPRLRSPDYLSRFINNVLSQTIDWTGHFSVVQENRVRSVPLPG